MNVVILSLAGPFTVGMLYKENWFARAAFEAGDKVTVICSVEKYRDGVVFKGKAGRFEYSEYTLIRIERENLVFPVLTDKIRLYRGLEDKIISASPDVIFCNGPQFYNIKQLPKLKKKLPNCRIIWGFSVWSGNSARSALSKYVLHGLIYRSWLKKAVRCVDKIFFTGEETEQFISEVYRLPMEKAELNELPGETIELCEKQKIKKDFKVENSLPDDAIIFLHSGKMNKEKKTVGLIREFINTGDERFRLYIAGSLDAEIADEFRGLIEKDQRIRYLGFLSGESLMRCLAASDVYLQPGSISQTFQNAICAGCAVVGDDVPNNRKLLNGNGWLIGDESELKTVFREISERPCLLEKMSAASVDMAKKRLDYKELYARIYK